jgi:predicted Ser/Thr protein kinase
MGADNRDRALPPVPSEPLRETDPRELGEFRLLGRLGSGGMGVAFLAEGQGQWAVVKMIRSDLADDRTFRARLSRELDAMKLAGHETTASLLAAEPYASPAWFAMEFIPGVTLARRVEDSGPLSMPEVQRLAADLAVVLARLHDVGITHRDIKPGNIMLSPDGPKIIDFGIADLAEGTALTRTGVVLGSTGWLAPEQVKGEEVTPATDVHAWALCVLFAASGSAPFGADTTTAAIYRVLEHSPEVPETVPDPLRDLLRSAIDKDPARRPTMAQIVDQLAGVEPEADAAAEAAAIAAAAAAAKGTGTTRAATAPTKGTAATVAAPASSPGAPPPAGPSPVGAGAKGPKWPLIALIAGAAVILIGIVVGVVLMMRGGGDTTAAPAAPKPSASAGAVSAPSAEPVQPAAPSARRSIEPVGPASPAAPEPSVAPEPSAVPEPSATGPGEVIAQPPEETAADVALVAINDPMDDFAQPFGQDVPIPPAVVKGTSSLVGDTYALYAGNRMEKELTCDRSRLADYFETSPSEAKVWADEMGVAPKDIRDAMYAMTPVVLRTDTVVTMHGISAGEPTQTPVVLQTGTSILAGKSGVPRMRCFGGNPLTPAPAINAESTFGGTQWELWDPAKAVVITQAPNTIKVYDLVNIDTDRMFTRLAGTHGTDDAIVNMRPPASIP